MALDAVTSMERVITLYDMSQMGSLLALDQSFFEARGSLSYGIHI